MNDFETNLKELVSDLHKFSLIEFYHNEIDLNKKISYMKKSLENYQLYLPKARVIVSEEEMFKTQTTIKVDVRERLNTFIEKIDHSFGLENYNWVQENIEDDSIKDIYKKLGPFDHFEHRDPDEAELD